jgi:hypothetical protein
MIDMQRHTMRSVVPQHIANMLRFTGMQRLARDKDFIE